MSEFKQLSDDALEKTPALKAEYDIIQAKIDAQKMQNVTQKKLSACIENKRIFVFER